MNLKKYILLVTVQNNFGVLARVSSLFGRRGFNIDSLTVSATNDPKISRMSIIVFGDEIILDQIIKQLSKLEEVICVDQLTDDNCFCSEQVFIKVKPDDTKVEKICALYGANVLEKSDDYAIMELSEAPKRIDEFVSAASKLTIIEMCRSGVTAIKK